MCVTKLRVCRCRMVLRYSGGFSVFIGVFRIGGRRVRVRGEDGRVRV